MAAMRRNLIFEIRTVPDSNPTAKPIIMLNTVIFIVISAPSKSNGSEVMINE
jgi:hypothetical protein